VSYEFPLQSLLRLYEALERREEARFSALSQRLAQARAELRDCDATKLALHEQMRLAADAGTTAGELHFQLDCVLAIQLQRSEVKRRLQELENQCAAQRRLLIVARRRREALESACEKQLAAYRQECLRRQQKTIDELFLMRAGRMGSKVPS
jgi:flagellar export protein FliJ